jgi:hypothetical protein
LQGGELVLKEIEYCREVIVCGVGIGPLALI